MRSFIVPLCMMSVASVSDTTCDEDEQSLLQTRPTPPRHSALAADPAMLLESAKELAHHMNRASPDIVDAAASSMRTALGQMTPLLEEEHRRAQGEINHQIEQIQACHSSASHGTAVRDDFADQLSTMNQCMADTAAAAEEQQNACDSWHGHARRLVFPSTLLPASSPPEEVYLVAEGLRDWVQDEWATIELQRRDCNDATARAAAEEDRCAPVVSEYDDTFCQHQLSCALHEACNNHELQVYRAMVADSGESAASRQQQFQTIIQVECILDVLTDAVRTNMTIDESTLSSCDANADVGHLTLVFPDPEVLPACPQPQGGDPPCPDIELPQAWANGEAVAPATRGFDDGHWAPPSNWNIQASSARVELWGPDNIKVTGDGSEFWHSNGSPPHTLSFDAGSEVTLAGFATVHPSNDHYPGTAFKDFIFYHSDDAQNYEEVLRGVGADLGRNERQEFRFPVTTSRYWRLVMMDNWGYVHGRYITIEYMEFREL